MPRIFNGTQEKIAPRSLRGKAGPQSDGLKDAPNVAIDLFPMPRQNSAAKK